MVSDHEGRKLQPPALQQMVSDQIASRGSASYNKVSSSLRTLSPEDYPAIADALEPLLPATPGIHPLAEFIRTLRAQS